MTEVSTESVIDQAQDIVSKLSIKRWRTIQTRFDLPIDELQNDSLAQLIIMAHEYWKVSTGSQRDNWDKFEDMNLLEIQEFLGLGEDDAEPKSEPGDTDK